jgi:hypothetical protein
VLQNSKVVSVGDRSRVNGVFIEFFDRDSANISRRQHAVCHDCFLHQRFAFWTPRLTADPHSRLDGRWIDHS